MLDPSIRGKQLIMFNPTPSIGRGVSTVHPKKSVTFIIAYLSLELTRGNYTIVKNSKSNNSANYFTVSSVIELTLRSRRCTQKRSSEDKSAMITVFFIMRIGTDGKGVLATYISIIFTYIYMYSAVQANKTNAEKTVGLTKRGRCV